MEQIVLNQNLRYIITALDLEQRGKLLNALLGLDSHNLEEIVEDIYKYIYSLQQDIIAKKKRMKDIGAKGNEAKKAQKLMQNSPCDNNISLSSHTPKNQNAMNTHSDDKRKEAKENINNNNINNIYNPKNKSKLNDIKSNYPTNVADNPPTLKEVSDFIDAQKLSISAEDFINFYTSRGWYVGKTAIKDWKTTARMWDKRTRSDQYDDTTYWSSIDTQPKKDTQTKPQSLIQEHTSSNLKNKFLQQTQQKSITDITPIQGDNDDK